MKRNHKPLLFIFLALIIFLPSIAFAVDDTNIVKPLADFVYCYLARVFKLLIWLAGLGSAVMIIAGGFYYITSTGDPAKVKKGQGAITAAIVGACITALAFALMFFVGKKVDPDFDWNYEMECSYNTEVKLDAVTPAEGLKANEVVEPPVVKQSCMSQADVVLVLDNSSSVGPDGLVDLKSAANVFVNTLASGSSKNHIGVVVFSELASLGSHLTNSTSSINTVINGIKVGNNTNLKDGLSLAESELSNPAYDRPDSTYPDYMVLITDGRPNPGTENSAAAEATKIKSAGIKIYAVGVTNNVDKNYLKNSIASSPSNYYPVSNYAELSSVLNAIANCQ